MLSKAIKLNLKIGAGDFAKAIIITIAAWLFTVVSATSMFSGIFPSIVLLAGTVISLVFSIKGLNKIFSSSLFNEEGSFYMVLPLSEKEIIWSKIIAGSIYMLVLSLATVVIALMMALITGADTAVLGTKLLDTYVDADLPPMYIGILMGLLPLKTLLQQLAFCAFAIAVLLFFNLIKPGKLSVVAWLAIYGVNAAVTNGLSFLYGRLLKNGFNCFLLEGCLDALYIVILFGLITYCIKTLGSKYNV